MLYFIFLDDVYKAQELLQAFFKDLRARLAARPKWKPPV